MKKEKSVIPVENETYRTTDNAYSFTLALGKIDL